ncbi:MAG TPA: PQQ-binding-like beta-propeller repeat protein [Anaeromyxobacter sp.]|nr:PQQ-binding-like beta-propeller repeat protein [Anaeromyxobacter sp.]
MGALALAVLLAAGPPAPRTPAGLETRLAPAPVDLYTILWHHLFEGPADPLAGEPIEPGGASVDPASGLVVVGTRDGWLHAIGPDGRVAWELRAEGGFSAPPAIDGDAVYAGSSDGSLYAVELKTGKVRWRYQAKEELGTRPAVAGGTVFVASLADTLYAVDARTGAWKWHHRREPRGGFTIRGAAWPQAGDGTVYAGYSDGFVAALDPDTGQVRWERQVAPPGDHLDVDALVLDGTRLYAAAFSGAVLALEASTGETVWQFKAPGACRLAVGRGLVVAVTPNGVYGLAAGGGQAAWSAPLGGAPGGNPVMAGKWVLVPAIEGGLRFIEAASGRTLRVLDPGTGVTATPGVGGGRVYVISNGGDLFALELS